jgi:glycolate oxidase iron-sulfur subunit
MNSMLGSINRSSVRLLNAAGYDVVVPAGQVCCSALANHAGLRDTAVEAARRNVAAFTDPGIEAIVINAAGCGAMLKEYPHILKAPPDFPQR